MLTPDILPTTPALPGRITKNLFRQTPKQLLPPVYESGASLLPIDPAKIPKHSPFQTVARCSFFQNFPQKTPFLCEFRGILFAHGRKTEDYLKFSIAEWCLTWSIGRART